MNEIIRNRTIRPSSRLETSKSYKIDTKIVSRGDMLIVNIDHETTSFNKSFRFKGDDLINKNSISFRVNDYEGNIEISWSGTQPTGSLSSKTVTSTSYRPASDIEIVQPKIQIIDTDYNSNENILRPFYEKRGMVNKLEKDVLYLKEASNEINQLWLNNLDKIETVNYLMVAEAPLWGKSKKYIYNPDVKNSQFFYRGDLGDVTNRHIMDKSDFINICNEIGLLIVDISPFPLNPDNTAINYRILTTNEYRQLVGLTISEYFAKKIEAIKRKKAADIKVFFRYARVRNTFQDIISRVLLSNGFIKNANEIEDISQSGGGINKRKLGQIIKTNF